jgi:hypothetical protein
MKTNIRYAIHPDGFVVSQMDSYFMWPILQYDDMTPENNFATSYTYERILIGSGEYRSLKFTKKIPAEVKNFHRRLWGLKELV